MACAQTDAGITTNVKTKMAADDTVKAYEIDVATANGVVTLTGVVDNPAAKEQAVMIVRGTDGVRDVIDRIEVNQAAATTGRDLRDQAGQAGREIREESAEAGRAVADAAVTAAVKSKFLADTAVKCLEIDVDTNDGIVTLNGTVATRTEADRAMMLARNTDGVNSVVNNLKVGSF